MMPFDANELAVNVVATGQRYKAEVLRLVQRHRTFLGKPVDLAKLSTWLREDCVISLDDNVTPWLYFLVDDEIVKAISLPSDYEDEGFTWVTEQEAYRELMKLTGTPVRELKMWEVHLTQRSQVYDAVVALPSSPQDVRLKIDGNFTCLAEKEWYARSLAYSLNEPNLPGYSQVVSRYTTEDI